MSITIQLDLPDALVREARANGLLESESMIDLLSTELRRRKAAVELKKVQNLPGDWRGRVKPPRPSRNVSTPLAMKPCPPELLRLLNCAILTMSMS